MPRIDRRRFLSYGAGLLVPAGLGAGLLVPLRTRTNKLALASGFSTPTLPGSNIPKFRDALTILRTMPRSGTVTDSQTGQSVDRYDVASRQFRQQVLPSGLPSTTVWGYGSLADTSTFHWPSATFEARFRTPVRVRWINQLVDSSGRFRPHLFAVDQTLHWANPPGGNSGRDSTPTFTSTPGPYRGPVPNVVHLHGSELSPQESDGYPEAWFLPNASNIPSGFARTGTFYDIFRRSSPLGNGWSAGNAIFQYPNDQRATTLWFHDHSLGMTRANVYTGLAGFYLLRGGPDDQVGGTLPSGRFEIPLIIQDRSFNSDGSLFYPDSREFFDGFPGPYIPGSDIPPQWNAEFFGDSMTVNGKTWPFLNVEQRRYRFRFLNACNSRFIILQNSNNLPIWQIGSDGGFLPAPVRRTQVLMGPAERVDAIVDFSDAAVGSTITLLNLGPDEPFGGGQPGVDFTSADPNTTGLVLQFRVVSRSSSDNTTPPSRLSLPFTPLGAASRTRPVSLNEIDSQVLAGVGPLRGMLGRVNSDGTGTGLRWADNVTETPATGSTELWEIWDFTEDAHPIHIHVTQFQIINREPIGGGTIMPPFEGESGFKDTVVALPGFITRVKPKFPRSGLFVWHCHILEHEDNEMMRPMRVG